MISQDRMEQALKYLAETDQTAADLKTDVERQDYRRKQIRAKIIISEEGAMEYRKAKAESSKEFDKATEDWLEAISKSDFVQNKRKTESLVFEAWRSTNANRRQGQV